MSDGDLPSLFADFAQVAQTLNEVGLPWVLCGGLAIGVHGFARATKDIDIIVRPEDVDAVKAAVKVIGYEFPALPMRFSGGIAIQRVTKIEGSQHRILDCLLSEGPLADIWGHVEKGSHPKLGVIPVLSKARLIIMKRAAGRPQDLVDIERLESGDSNG